MLPILETMAENLYPQGRNVDPVVDFGKGELLRILGEALTKALRDKVTNPEFAFISRSDLGIYSLLHRLNAKVNTTAIWCRVGQQNCATVIQAK